MPQHHYSIEVRWTGNQGQGTASYTAYRRDHVISAGTGKAPIPGSADPAFRGDPARWNPEELFVAAVSACHKLWYLHLCADAGIVVHEYVDRAEGVMIEESSGAGRFTSITLEPRIVVASGADLEKARSLHGIAHEKCFIANSIRTPVTVEAEIVTPPD